MRRKHNPYVALVALLLLALIVSWICSGCHAEVAAATEPTEPTYRFAVDNAPTSGTYAAYIITDTETGVQYLFFRNGYCGGICKLEVG